VADFTSVALENAGTDQVRLTGARGKPATETYKVSIAYRSGYTASGTLTILGPEAAAKARLCGEMILRRLARIGLEPQESNVEFLGAGACVPGVIRPGREPGEVVLRATVHDSRRTLVERFSKEFAPLVTSGPPGVTGYTAARPPVREVFAYWPALVDKKVVKAKVEML
jgi:hypothetical protein